MLLPSVHAAAAISAVIVITDPVSDSVTSTVADADGHWSIQPNPAGVDAKDVVVEATDEAGNVQPDRASFIARTGTNALFHYNAQQTWAIDAEGKLRNVLA